MSALVIPGTGKKEKREKKSGRRKVLKNHFFVFVFHFDLFFPMPPSSSSRALLRGLGHPAPEEIENLRELVEWLEHTKVRVFGEREREMKRECDFDG